MRRTKDTKSSKSLLLFPSGLYPFPPWSTNPSRHLRFFDNFLIKVDLLGIITSLASQSWAPPGIYTWRVRAYRNCTCVCLLNNFYQWRHGLLGPLPFRLTERWLCRGTSEHFRRGALIPPKEETETCTLGGIYQRLLHQAQAQREATLA